MPIHRIAGLAAAMCENGNLRELDIRALQRRLIAEGVLEEWGKQIGDEVSEGDVLAIIETDKASVEVASFQTGVLLQHLDELAAYVPVDISEDHLLESASQIRREFPGLDVLPVVADFTQPFQLPTPRVMPVRNVVYFPGSTIGNFTNEAAQELLAVMHGEARADGALLIGVDLKKPVGVLNAAYNDAAGVTAELYLGKSGFKAQLKYADRRNAPVAVIVGGNEFDRGEVADLARDLALDPDNLQTLLALAPKSVTTPVAMGITERLGGLPSLTAVLVILTGILGAMLGPILLDLLRIRDERARGLALGTASHGIGTARALQISEVAGAFAGLSPN